MVTHTVSEKVLAEAESFGKPSFDSLPRIPSKMANKEPKGDKTVKKEQKKAKKLPFEKKPLKRIAEAKASTLFDWTAKDAEYASKYPHYVKGSLSKGLEEGKRSAKIKCTECGKLREVFTSDIFQVKLCEDCKGKARRKLASQPKKPNPVKEAMRKNLLDQIARRKVKSPLLKKLAEEGKVTARAV